MNWLRTNNRKGCVRLTEIPVVDYDLFYRSVSTLLQREECHVVEYFALPEGRGLRFYILVADDSAGQVLLASYVTREFAELESLTAAHPAMHVFEREIAELYDIKFTGNPWPKPLRYPSGGSADAYPFYHIEGDSLHEVNVGPIHAGIIEPGAFRFICNGEKVLHLEIALGYQHRGLEKLMCEATTPIRRACLAESVAGDSAISHATAHCLAMERLAEATLPGLDAERAVMLELERMAIHLADVGALCTDIAYQLGQVACEALRTIVINTTQRICGNRFGKGYMRPGGGVWRIEKPLAEEIGHNVAQVRARFAEVLDDLQGSPSVLARFEECGVVSRARALSIGAVGMAARASGVARDVRSTHPWGVYGSRIAHQPVLREQGDVMARLVVRGQEIFQSIGYIDELLGMLPEGGTPMEIPALQPSCLSFAMVEGWRGEICHVAVTDGDGRLAGYKIKDPSMHNWLALALSVRGQGISDFPICNKSFNLSYCGHDL